MSWRLDPTADLAPVAELYAAVFDEPMDASTLRDRARGGALHAYLVRRRDEPPVGFALFLGQEGDVELWHAGVLPGRRRQGAGGALLDQGERAMAELGYSRLTVRTFNHWNVMLSMLTRRGWRVVGTGHSERHQDLHIDLHKALRTRRELRYAVTHQCNFDCVFCHMEGLGEQEKRPPAPVAQVIETLGQAVELGYTDITFTGGEPLLEWPRLERILAGLAELPHPPDVTVVSNGARLTPEVTQGLLGYPGRRKLHLSLHAVDPDSFARVTRRRADLFERVRDNVRMASEAGLEVKVNHVVLQELNHDRVLEMVELARSLGARTLKLLELLVLPETPSDFGLFYKVSALERALVEVADGPEQDGLRRRRWRHRSDTDFVIEVQRLTCALGCVHCREVRDRTLSADLCYHPCFVRCGESFPVGEPTALQEVFSRGDRLIDDYAARFGEESPTLIHHERMVPGRSEIFLRVLDQAAIRRALAVAGFAHRSSLAFHEEYLRPRHRAGSWDRFERVLKLGWDRPDRSKVDLVYTDVTYEPTEHGLRSRGRFLYRDGPLQLPDEDKARHLMERLDFEVYMVLDWAIERWSLGELEVSLGEALGVVTLKVDGAPGVVEGLFRLLAEAGAAEALAPLHLPLPGFMLETYRNRVV